MDLLTIGSINTLQNDTLNTQNSIVQNSNGALFDEFYNAAIGVIDMSNTQLAGLEDLQLKIASGQSDDFIGLTNLQNKATASFQFVVQATNKVVEAYREIMRMQI